MLNKALEQAACLQAASREAKSATADFESATADFNDTVVNTIVVAVLKPALLKAAS